MSCVTMITICSLIVCFRLTVLVIILESRHLSEYPAHDEKDDDVHDQHPVLKEFFWLNLMLEY